MTFMNVSLSAPVAPAAHTITGSLGVVGARFIIDGGSSEGRFSLVEHPIVARGMAAPLHLHTREDEYSFILEGRWGFWQGGSLAFAGPGDLVYKPRDVWHTFWNATDGPARLLEIISPAGFDQFFVELAALISSGPGQHAGWSRRLTPLTGFTSISKEQPESPPSIVSLPPCPSECGHEQPGAIAAPQRNARRRTVLWVAGKGTRRIELVAGAIRSYEEGGLSHVRHERCARVLPGQPAELIPERAGRLQTENALIAHQHDLTLRPITGPDELDLFNSLPYVLNDEVGWRLGGRAPPPGMAVARPAR